MRSYGLLFQDTSLLDHDFDIKTVEHDESTLVLFITVSSYWIVQCSCKNTLYILTLEVRALRRSKFFN